MRQKPPATTFSVKALSFYGNDNRVMQTNNILVQSTDKVNFATHDQQMTTNRETNEDVANKTGARMGNMRTSGTLTNLIQSIRNSKEQQAMLAQPEKQVRKYGIDLGQNVS